MNAPPLVRIGELARRAGVPPATLRAWERRYRIVEPTRTEAGYRLYSEDDERRLKAMIDLITGGAAPAEAAHRVLDSERSIAGRSGTNSGSDLSLLRTQLSQSLARFDEAGAQRAIDRAVDAYSTETLITDLLLPVLRDTGELWSEGKLSVGQEHFASNLIRTRLLGLGRGWGSGIGPLILLACPPGEDHDLGLVCFGLILNGRGCRIAFLGADTPLATIAGTAEQIGPRLVVLPVTIKESADALAAGGPLELPTPIAIAGAAATPALAERIGARLLPADVIAAAREVAATVR